MMKIKLILFIFMITSGLSYAQVMISNEQNRAPVINANALLELRSASMDKGLLIPRIALTSTSSAAPLSSHVVGMTVYNTQSSGSGTSQVVPGFYYNNGTSWNRIAPNTPVIGDIKYGTSTADHSGWYLLDGRAVSTLSSTARTNATSLGFTTNLPNASDRFLKARQGTEVLGSTGGNSAFSISQSNLPNITYNGTTSSAGDHTHTYNDRASGSFVSILGSSRVVNNTEGSQTTGSAGNHNHTFSVSTGGSQTPINFVPPYLSSYIFVYLGS